MHPLYLPHVFLYLPLLLTSHLFHSIHFFFFPTFLSLFLIHLFIQSQTFFSFLLLPYFFFISHSSSIHISSIFVFSNTILILKFVKKAILFIVLQGWKIKILLGGSPNSGNMCGVPTMSFLKSGANFQYFCQNLTFKFWFLDTSQKIVKVWKHSYWDQINCSRFVGFRENCSAFQVAGR